jgi:hypothetical protein
VSRFSTEAIHLEGIEVPNKNPRQDDWWRFEFSSDHERIVRSHWLYSKGLPPLSERRLIDYFLIPSGTWKEAYGQPRFEGVHRL